MLENFYQKSREEIKTKVKQFIDTDLYIQLPELKGIVSIIATGSVATNNYDQFSDIDLKILFTSEDEVKKYSLLIKKYKEHIREINEPIQVHKADTYSWVESTLATWQDDGLLREYAQALVIDDVKNAFVDIQKKFSYYPKEVHQEKIQWLFAELIFQIKERFEAGMQRKDAYFCEVIKLQIVRLFLNSILLMNHKYPAFDKHLCQDVKKIAPQEIEIVDELMQERDLSRMALIIKQVRNRIEKLLLENQLIKKKETEQYWLDLRPAYQVKLA